MVVKTTWKLRLDSIVDTSEATKATKDEIKEEIGEFLVDRMLEDISKQKSPVDNRKFDKLSKPYATFKRKSGRRGVPNLELEGLMLDALEHKPYRDGVEVGIFEEDQEQVQKSDNHNKFSAKSKGTGVPERQFIPRKKQKMRPGIMREVKKIAKDILERNE
jgi:hypothetical protein